MKDSLNHILMNMIGQAHTSRQIIEDGDILILSVVLNTLTRMVLMTSPKSTSHAVYRVALTVLEVAPY